MKKKKGKKRKETKSKNPSCTRSVVKREMKKKKRKKRKETKSKNPS